MIATPDNRVPFLSSDGTVSLPWFMFLSSMLQAIGGPAVGPGGGAAPVDNTKQFEEYPLSNPDALEALRGVDELRNAIASISNDGQALRSIYDELNGALAGIRNLTDLRNRVDDVESLVESVRPTPLLPSTEQFIAPALLNSWIYGGAPYNPPGYYKDSLGRVHLRGFVTTGAVGTTIFTLPVGYRPANTELIATGSAGLFGLALINNVGNVQANVGSSSWFSLDNITFRAA